MAYNSRLQSSFIQTYPENTGNTVGTVVSTVRAFRLADCTADRDSHPALKLCGDKGIPFFKKFKIILKVYFKFLYLQSCNTDNCGNSSVGRASASQAEGRGFDSRFPLNQGRRCSQNIYGFVVPIKYRARSNFYWNYKTSWSKGPSALVESAPLAKGTGM